MHAYRLIPTIFVVFIASVAHAALLGIPTPNTTHSGIGVISGWICEPNGPLTIRFDGGNAIPLLYGSERRDTSGVCGDANNGFIAVMNWSNLGDGEHIAVVYDNGVEFDRATFRVVTTGIEFLRGVAGTGSVDLSNGQIATVKWSEASQGFMATNFTATPTVGSGNGGCTSRTLTTTVYDSHRPRSGGRATWTIERDCEYPDNLYLDITAHTAFGFSLAALSFVQDGYVYGFGHVYEEWVSPHMAGEDYAPGETDSLKIERMPGSGLDFSQPFTIRYYGNMVLTFE